MNLRAATSIVGAIAVSSILVALAFILSGGDNSGGAQVTRTVIERVAAAKPTSPAGEPAGRGPGATRIGGPTQCEGGEFTVEHVSCEVGAQIRAQYDGGGRGELFAEDQEIGETITMSCSGSAPVTCTGPGGAAVYFAK